MNDNLRIASDWTLHDATLTAIAERGRVFNEHGLSLRLMEGRNPQIHFLDDHVFGEDDGNTREVWDYQLNFYLVDAKDNDNSQQDECRVAIVGVLEDGRQCKIIGQGYVGRDNLNQLEGTFFYPPRIELSGAGDDMIEWDRPPDPPREAERVS